LIPKSLDSRIKFDNVTKTKFGIEATYSMLSWLAASMRFDRVDPNLADTRYSFSVLSPRSHLPHGLAIHRSSCLAVFTLVQWPMDDCASGRAAS